MRITLGKSGEGSRGIGISHRVYKVKVQPLASHNPEECAFRDFNTMVTIKIGETGEPIVTRLVAEDKVPWYRKRNLRYMYFFLFLCCMGVEMTSGFDSQLINTLQFSGPFNKCRTPSLRAQQRATNVSRFRRRLCG